MEYVLIGIYLRIRVRAETVCRIFRYSNTIRIFKYYKLSSLDSFFCKLLFSFRCELVSLSG